MQVEAMQQPIKAECDSGNSGEVATKNEKKRRMGKKVADGEVEI